MQAYYEIETQIPPNQRKRPAQPSTTLSVLMIQ